MPDLSSVSFLWPLVLYSALLVPALGLAYAYAATLSDYFDFGDDFIWKDSYFEFNDSDHLQYQFDDCFKLR